MENKYEAVFKAEQYDKYKDLIDVIETLHLDINSVINLIYIHAAEIDLSDENNIKLINELYADGKIIGYEKIKGE